MKATTQSYYTTANLAIGLAFVVGIFYFRRKILQFPYYKELCGALCVIFTWIMMSGQMWNRMQRPRKYSLKKKVPFYFSNSFGEQYLYESYMVAAMYGAVAVGMIMMIEALKSKETSPQEGKATEKEEKRRFNSFVRLAGLAIFCAFFSLLMSVFRAKLDGFYPYRFLFS